MLTRIEAERTKHKLPREKLVDQLGVSMKTYSDWINERHDIPGIKLIRLSQILGCSAETLLQSDKQDRLPISGYTIIIVETDEENPVQIAAIESDNICVAKGYRVRLKPVYERYSALS